MSGCPIGQRDIVASGQKEVKLRGANGSKFR